MTKAGPRRNRVAGRQFKVVSSGDGRATPASRLQWFVTAHSTRHQVIDGVVKEWPISLVHGKQMGSTVTACGTPSVSWPKLYHLPFPPARTEVCRECLAAIHRG